MTFPVKNSIGIYLEISKSGFLKAIYFNADADADFETLRRLLERLVHPRQFSWISRLLTHWQ